MPLSDRLYGYYDTEPQLASYLLKRNEALLAEGRAYKETIRTKEQLAAYRERVRSEFLANIGGLPAERTPLQTRWTGEVACEGFTIRKLYFESLPGYYVTANLYVPDGLTGPAPAVLFVCGHDEASKASLRYQYVCRDLARTGFVVLSIDPMSQGERTQAYLAEAGRAVMRWYCEHTYYALPCEWAGNTTIRYFIWDMIRAMDLLCDLPEVDAARIGVTGNSGGGLQSALLMMADDRLAAGMPVTFIKSAGDYMLTGQPQDGDMFWPRQLAMLMDDDDYLTAFAPKPACIGAVESDFFCVEGVLESYESAKRMYGLAGAPENLELALVPGLHQYNTALRQAAVRFFVRALMGVSSDFIAEENPGSLDPSALWAAPEGQVALLPGFKPIWRLTADYMENHLPPPPKSVGELRTRLAGVLKMPDGLDAPIHMRYLTDHSAQNFSENHPVSYRRREMFFLSEPGIALGAVWITSPGREAKRCTLLVLEDGLMSCDWEKYWIERIVLDGSDILVIDPRGAGAVKQREVTVRGYYETCGTEHKMSYDADMCGLSLTGLRVFDLLRGARFLSEQYGELALAGRGIGALWVTLAAPFVPKLAALHREDPPAAFRRMATEPFYHYDARLRLPGILQAADVGDIMALLRQEGVQVTEFTRPDFGKTNKW